MLKRHPPFCVCLLSCDLWPGYVFFSHSFKLHCCIFDVLPAVFSSLLSLFSILKFSICSCNSNFCECLFILLHCKKAKSTCRSRVSCGKESGDYNDLNASSMLLHLHCSRVVMSYADFISHFMISAGPFPRWGHLDRKTSHALG